MKKRTVVLCELCEEDRLAATVVSWGLCGEHVDKIGAVVRTSRRQPTIHANKGHTRRVHTKRLHKPCGEVIDPRGWTQHVRACKGKGTVATRRKAAAR